MNSALTLVALATGGTVALASAAFLFGFNKKEVIKDEAAVRKYLRSHAPSAVLETIVIADDHYSALVVTNQNTVWLLVLMGDGPIVRHVVAENIQQTGENSFLIDVGDFGFPKRYFLKDRRALASILEAFEKGQIQ